MIKIVLDSNVLISAIVFGGKPRSVLNLAIEGMVSLFLSPSIIEETTSILEGKKFGFPKEKILIIQHELENLATIIYPTMRLDIIQADPSDNKILECAVTARAHYIISGDQHLLKIKTYQQIQIVTPQIFLDLIF